MSVYTTEIASDKIASDNPIHQRLLKAYYLAEEYVHGDLFEIGCGEGRGIALLKDKCKSYTAIDKIQEVIDQLQKKYPDVKLIQGNIPPFAGIADNSFDVIISFQVIEHIKNDKLYLQEIHRVLKPGGKALITTPNIKKTLTRNPWHIREYKATELENLAKTVFPKVEMKGVAGNDKVMEYYEMNKKSVEKITRFDILNLQYRLPAPLLRIPYDLLNRMNRNKLKTSNDSLVNQIHHTDYLLTDQADGALDLFCIMEK
ncbi:class I SAM-dependent methyltransferase [Fulvivirga sediminis]|uniref:Methyltransferase domain-containing protein n=1 Tax=Fulvivirga sediminis TaxID=2803949 RepID=A0A937JXT7_9BACT|nr:class I SAM-dependent methyltransferase [Fulvivirga sediminis]MBL3654969.1 methyltransferase domain-containing protein [Fulvivirga sediminis]